MMRGLKTPTATEERITLIEKNKQKGHRLLLGLQNTNIG
jgi:hypothetical protein